MELLALRPVESEATRFPRKQIEYTYTDIRSLDNHVDKNISIQGRIHSIRHKGSICFLIIRYQKGYFSC